ncbi:hypothetical protein JOQ06_023014, partial [Pogonophryne albipinna]
AHLSPAAEISSHGRPGVSLTVPHSRGMKSISGQPPDRSTPKIRSYTGIRFCYPSPLILRA